MEGWQVDFQPTGAVSGGGEKAYSEVTVHGSSTATALIRALPLRRTVYALAVRATAPAALGALTSVLTNTADRVVMQLGPDTIDPVRRALRSLFAMGKILQPQVKPNGIVTWFSVPSLAGGADDDDDEEGIDLNDESTAADDAAEIEAERAMFMKLFPDRPVPKGPIRGADLLEIEAQKSGACELPEDEFNADKINNCESCMCKKGIRTSKDVRKWLLRNHPDKWSRRRAKWAAKQQAAFVARTGRRLTEVELGKREERLLQNAAEALQRVTTCNREGILCDPTANQALRRKEGTLEGRRVMEAELGVSILLDGMLGKADRGEGMIRMQPWPWAKPTRSKKWGRASIFVTDKGFEALDKFNKELQQKLRRSVIRMYFQESQLSKAPTDDPVAAAAYKRGLARVMDREKAVVVWFVEEFLAGVLGRRSHTQGAISLVGQDNRFALSYLVEGACSFARLAAFTPGLFGAPLAVGAAEAAAAASDATAAEPRGAEFAEVDFDVDSDSDSDSDSDDETLTGKKRLRRRKKSAADAEAEFAAFRARLAARAEVADTTASEAAEAEQLGKEMESVLDRRGCGPAFKQFNFMGYHLTLRRSDVADKAAEMRISRWVQRMEARMEALRVPYLVRSVHARDLVPVLLYLCEPYKYACMDNFSMWARTVETVYRAIKFSVSGNRLMDASSEFKAELQEKLREAQAAQEQAAFLQAEQARALKAKAAANARRREAKRRGDNELAALMAARAARAKTVDSGLNKLVNKAVAKKEAQLADTAALEKEVKAEDQKIAKARREARLAAETEEERQVRSELRKATQLVLRKQEALSLRQEAASGQKSIMELEWERDQGRKRVKLSAKAAARAKLILNTLKGKLARPGKTPAERKALRKRIRETQAKLGIAVDVSAEAKRAMHVPRSPDSTLSNFIID